MWQESDSRSIFATPILTDFMISTCMCKFENWHNPRHCWLHCGCRDTDSVPVEDIHNNQWQKRVCQVTYKYENTIYAFKTFCRFEEERLRMKFNANSNPIFKQATTTIQNPMFCKESWNPELDHEHWSIKHKSPHKYILKKMIQKRAKFPWDQREVRISSSHQLLVSCK